ncbi:helix-turn-helix domain-containing protein [Paenibacillus sp. GYB004]|uniref:helix-turn-helix domain-containing protein n=1 Tax=Paenibacillus sp. GYB004 TaxID=2994393 RepID=UPI003FA734A8
MNLSYSYFSKYFKRVMGLSFIEYVSIRRIKQAERLLLTMDGSIATIAEQPPTRATAIGKESGW